MMIVDLHVMLELATRSGTVRLVAWREGRELFDEVTVSDHHGIATLPFRPDAFFTLQDSAQAPGANNAHFFLEADRSSSTHTKFRDKFRAYWHYLRQELQIEKFGIKNFRVRDPFC